jgi:hypothetical protein
VPAGTTRASALVARRLGTVAPLAGSFPGSAPTPTPALLLGTGLHPDDGVFAAHPKKALLRFLDDLDIGLVTLDSEFLQRGLDGDVHRLAANFDVLHRHFLLRRCFFAARG